MDAVLEKMCVILTASQKKIKAMIVVVEIVAVAVVGKYKKYL
jgi:hypothetical protein